GVTGKVEQNINREKPKDPTGTVLGHLPPPCLYHPRLFLMAEYHFPYMRNKIQTYHQGHLIITRDQRYKKKYPQY
ncbi:MAG TPA: hypothetical protein VER14_02435, partial [Phototrophicaceae bacterium]|nr:hypothetical protein [Phototrophicaceae bacterium]